jgi:hypothetical protein
LSTSAIKTIVEHNRLIDRTPLTTPRVAPERSFKRAFWLISKNSFRRLTNRNQRAGRVAGLLSKLSQLRGHGPGAGLGVQSSARSSIAKPAQKHSLALKPYPRPDRLRHLMSQARFDAGMENLRREDPLLKRSLHEPARQTRFRELAFRAASHAPSRKETRSAAPKVPSIDEQSQEVSVT